MLFRSGVTRTTLRTGVEYLWFKQYLDSLKDDPLRSDRNELVYALQFTNNASYQGYNLWTEMGFRVSRIDRDAADKARTETNLFVTVYAGLD